MRWLACFCLVACSSPPAPIDGGHDVDGGHPSIDSGQCPGLPSCPACNNGIDDDHDGRIDYPLDPGCTRREDTDEGEPPPPAACANDMDDDHDGHTDYPDDPGCANEEDDDETDPPPPACSNAADDDRDGHTDYPDDPGCASASDDDEADLCPDGAGCPECANGQDDDRDTQTDYPDDPECLSASDADEACVLVGGFDDDWPGPWVTQGGFPPFMTSRRISAAHDGTFGILNSLQVLTNPTVITGRPGERASVWTRAEGDPASSIEALHFAVTDTSSYQCMLNLAGQLLIGSSTTTSDLVVLDMTACPREAFTWYRLEVAFPSFGTAECRLFAEGATTPIATLSHSFGVALDGAVGVRGFPQAAFDTVEVCR